LQRPFNISDNGYVLPFTVNYEADLLRKNHDKTASAKKQYDAIKFQEKSAYISICSSVATVYFNIIKNDRLIELQSNLAGIKNEQLRRMKFRHSQGLAAQQEVNTYEENYKSAKNDLDSFVKSRALMLHELAVLVENSPQNPSELARTSFDELDFYAQIPDYIPSEVIFARPDVLSAEAQLQSAKIDVAVARKELLPEFKIYGQLGFNTFTSNPFFSWKGAFAFLLAGFSQSIFTGGRKVANLRMKKSIYDELFETYRQSTLKALQEVNDSLSEIKFDNCIDKENAQKVELECDNFCRTNKKYRNGVISCPEVLSEEEKLIFAQTQKVESKINLLINYLGLYKATGGQM